MVVLEGTWVSSKNTGTISHLPLPAYLHTHRHTDAALVAMEVVDTQALSDTTKTAVVACVKWESEQKVKMDSHGAPASYRDHTMINLFVRVVVPQTANLTPVRSKCFVTFPTIASHRLYRVTVHAHHGLSGMAIELMRRACRGFIVTEATNVPLAAARGLELGATLVVLASESHFVELQRCCVCNANVRAFART